MKSMTRLFLLAALAFTVTVGLMVNNMKADSKTAIDDEGFILKWLVVAPIPFAANDSASDAYSKDYVKEIEKLKPKTGEKLKVNEKEVAWKEVTSESHVLDFNKFIGDVTENSVAYAVTYIVADQEYKDIKIKVGSDDMSKVYLNGKLVTKCEGERALEKDQETETVTLNKGVNVIVAKVINASIDFSLCVRFTDKDDKPVTKLTAQSKPE